VTEREREQPVRQPRTTVSDSPGIVTWGETSPAPGVVTWGDPPPPHLMIDPSMLLSPVSFEALVRATDEESAEPLFLPASFLDALEPSAFDQDVWRHFAPAPRAVPPSEEREPSRERESAVRHASRIRAWVAENDVRPYTPTREEVSSAQSSGTIAIASSLRERYRGATGQILYEEWLFLQEHSWIGSRTRWAFGRFISAGGVAVEVGRRGYQAALEHASEEIPRLLTRRGMKGVARWIATAGAGAGVSAALPLGGIEQLLIGGAVRFATNQAAKHLFILIDP
jgi:hypothetical protein